MRTVEPPVGLSALGTSEFGLYGVVGGKMVIELLAGTMRLVRGGIAAVGCSSMGAGSMGGEDYCGNLLWQSSLLSRQKKTTVAIYCGNHV